MSFLPKKIWLNGVFVDPRRPVVSAFDRGFLYGDGVYESIRAYGGEMFCYEDHFKRLRSSASGVGIRIPYSRETVRRAAARLLRLTGLREAVVRLTLTRGPGPLGFDTRPCRRPTLLVAAVPPSRHSARSYRDGVRVLVARVRRNPKEALDPSLKSINNLNNIFAKMEAVRRKAYEALMLSVDGVLTEGTISNVFFRAHGTLKTPSLDCGLLAGVTRSTVLRLARRAGIKTLEGRFRKAALFSATEVFITSTTLEVMPVTSLVDEDGRVRPVGSGKVGDWAPRLREAYRRLVGTPSRSRP